MSTDTYNSYPPDNTLTTELREWVQNDIFVYTGSYYEMYVDCKGPANGFYGKKHTEESRKSMSDSNNQWGKKHSEETKKKIIENTKKGMTAEGKKKISDARKLLVGNKRGPYDISKILARPKKRGPYNTKTTKYM